MIFTVDTAAFVETYRGWRITFDRYRPATGTWRAERHGVGMCNSTLESLKRMVDVRGAA